MHIMLDLETWGKSPGCNLRSIGAVAFDPIKKEVYEATGFYTAVDRHEALFDDPDTVAWWSKQSAAAQSAFDNPIPLSSALFLLTNWSSSYSSPRFWANSPQFDISIIDHCYGVVGSKSPIPYWTHRDCRTVNDLANIDAKKFRSKGTAHHALDDAIAQAHMVCEAYKVLGL
jgi:hypothetical protein